MIKARVLPHSGAVEVSSMVRDLTDWAVWIEWAVYSDCTIEQARKMYRQYVTDKGYIVLDNQTV